MEFLLAEFSDFVEESSPALLLFFVKSFIMVSEAKSRFVLDVLFGALFASNS